MFKKTFLIFTLLITCFIGFQSTEISYAAVAKDSTQERLIIPRPAFIPGPSEATQGDQEKIKGYFMGSVLGKLTQGTIMFSGLTCFLYILYAGILMIGHFGSEESLTNAKKIITWAIVGLIISILSYAIVAIVIRIFPGQTFQDTKNDTQTELNNNDAPPQDVA